MASTVYLIDGSGYIFRAYFAIMQLTNSKGFPSNALYGFVKMILRFLDEKNPEYVAMVFDCGRETFRTEIYPEYKANREDCPEDLKLQMPYFRDFSQAIGLQVLEKPGFEADDIIGTLAKRLEKDGHNVVIVSGDKDLMQLVNDKVLQWDPMKDKLYDRAAVKEKLGVYPENVTDFLGLVGDSSDNIPGLKGVGPKTAVDLIERFGKVEEIIKNAEVIRNEASIRNRNKVADALVEHQTILEMSKKLAEVHCSVNTEFQDGVERVELLNADDEHLKHLLSRKEPVQDQLQYLISEFEFASLFKTFSIQPKAKTTSKNIIVNKENYSEFIKDISSKGHIAFDVETDSLDTKTAKLVGISFAGSADLAYYLPLLHPDISFDLEHIKADLIKIFSNPDIKKLAHNLKFDLSVLAWNGIPVLGNYFDTMLASYLLNPDSSSHALKNLAKRLLGVAVIEYQDLVKGLDSFAQVPIQQAAEYCCQDSVLTWMLYEKFLPELKSNDLLDVFNKLEMPLIQVLADIEERGILLDVDFLKSMSLEMETKLAELTSQIYENVGGEFNINSPKQLAEVLFTKLNLPTKGLKKTKTGISTDSNVLEKLVDLHPVPKLLLEYRQIFKLKSTYVDALPALISAKTGRLHTSLNQTVTGTGRLSSSNPNLQNIPIQSAMGRSVRKAFIASPGNQLISADYSQIELRLLAHMSEDPALIEAFRNNQDIHARTARDILDIPPLFEVTPEQRRIGKTINFGIVYGMGAQRLARELEISVPMASKYITGYFQNFAAVKNYFDFIEESFQKNGYVKTLFGRKRFIADIDTSERDFGFLRRAAINAPFQGTAADIIKLAMIDLNRHFRSTDVKLILQIHDELLFECPEDQCLQVIEIIREKMEKVCSLLVPLKVDVNCGLNWNDCH